MFLTVSKHNRAFFRGAVLSFLLGMLVVSTPVGGSISSGYAASCVSLASDFKRRGKPQFLRVVNKNRGLANYYNSTLKRLRSGNVPTTREMRQAYKRTLGSCSSGKCRTDAKRIYNAALKLHAYNRRWARSGCPGTLSS